VVAVASLRSEPDVLAVPEQKEVVLNRLINLRPGDEPTAKNADLVKVVDESGDDLGIPFLCRVFLFGDIFCELVERGDVFAVRVPQAPCVTTVTATRLPYHVFQCHQPPRDDVLPLRLSANRRAQRRVL